MTAVFLGVTCVFKGEAASKDFEVEGYCFEGVTYTFCGVPNIFDGEFSVAGLGGVIFTPEQSCDDKACRDVVPNDFDGVVKTCCDVPNDFEGVCWSKGDDWLFPTD